MLTLARYLELSTPAELSETERCSAHLKKPLALGAGLRYTQSLPIKRWQLQSNYSREHYWNSVPSFRERTLARQRGVAKKPQLWLKDCKPTQHWKTKCTCLAHYVQNIMWKQHCLKGQMEPLKNKNARMVTPITSATYSAIAFRYVCLGALIICFSWGMKWTVHPHWVGIQHFGLTLLFSARPQTLPCLLYFNQTQLWRQNN